MNVKAKKEPLHPKLEAIEQVIPGLAKMLGSRYEVILHDLSHTESSIVVLAGDVTHRKLGGPATNYLLHLLQEGDGVADSVNYQNQMPDGRVLRSSTMFIRDDEGRILGSLCINKDLSDYVMAMNVLKEEVDCVNDKREAPRERFTADIGEVMESVVDAEVQKTAKPVAYMQKEDKLAVVETLEKKGIFAIRNAVEHVAERLGVTSFTIYNYLKEIRGKQREKIV